MIAIWFKRPGQPDVKMLFDKLPSDAEIKAMQEFITAVENGKLKSGKRTKYFEERNKPLFIDRSR